MRFLKRSVGEMGLGPITRIGEIAGVDPAGNDREVKPPFGLEHSDRMGQDSYRGSGDEGERGLEDEEETPETGPDSTDSKSTMSVIA